MRALFRKKPRHRKSRLLVKVSAVATALLIGGAGMAVSAPAFANGNSGNTNSASYWEGQFDHPATCYKHDGNSEHGKITNGGKAVTLYTFNQSWPGDHWEALIVKGGSVDNGSGPGNVVYTHPSAGTPYFAPLNAGGQQASVSHWIVCKGTTPATKLDASASVSVTPATCDAPAKLVYGPIVNATWSGTPNGTTGPGSYSVVATADYGHEFLNESSTQSFSGQLDGKLTGPECDPFDWNWEYAAPTCDALTVVYPGNIPDGQANDVNIRFTYGPGFSQTMTLNFHNNGGTWSGTKVFNYADHPNFASITGKYRVTWVQVAGTNYHWQGEIECGEEVIPKDAAASVTVTPATCDSPGEAHFTIVNATWDGPAVLTDGTYTRTATANTGHQFDDGADTKTVTYQLEDILDPNAPPCYTPSTVVTPVIEFTPGTCFTAGGVTAVETDTYSWTVSGPQSARLYTAVPKGNVELTQTVFGPYDMRIMNHNSIECQPEFTVEQACGYVKITYTNNSRWDRWPDFRFTGDGVTGVDYGSGLTYTNVKVASGESKVIFEKTFDEDYNGGAVDVWYQDILGAERDIDTTAVKLTIQTNCEPTLVTTFGVPTASDVCGIKNDKLSIPENTNQVSYEITNDTRVNGVGSVTVEMSANADHELEDGVQTSWTFQFTNKPCQPQLPPTGAEVSGLLAAGGILLLIGGGLATASMIRRRQAQ